MEGLSAIILAEKSKLPGQMRLLGSAVEAEGIFSFGVVFGETEKRLREKE